MAYGMNTLGFTAGAMSNDPFETEEERRRRLEQEAAAQRQKLSAPTPVKQTITTDPVTGEQKMTITGSPQDLSAANPRTPTVVPVAPVDYSLLPRDMTQPGLASQIQTLPKTPDQQIAAQDIRPVAAPVTAPAPVAPEMVGQQADIRRADNAMMPSEPAPVAPAAAPAAVETPALGQGIMPGETAGIPTTATGGIDYDNILSGGQVNSKIRSKLIQDPNASPMYRHAAVAQEEQDLRKQKEMANANKMVTQALATGDQKTLAQAMRGGDGNFLKAALFSALGAKDLARNELEKLGFISGKWQTMTDSQGKKAVINVRSDGAMTQGYDETGRPLTAEQMVQYSTPVGKAGIDIVGGSYVNDKTGEVGRLVTDKTTGQSYIQTDTGRKPMTGFRPQASTGTLADMRARAIQELNIKLQGKTAEEQMAIMRPYNQQLVAAGYPPIQPTELTLQAPQIGAPAAPAAAPTAPVAPAAQAAPATAAPVAPVAPSAVPAAPAATTPAPAAGPSALTATTPTLRPSAGARPTGPALEASAAAAKEAATAQAKVVGEDVGKVKANWGKIKEDVDTVQNLSNQLLQHPGFSVAVGASAQPGFQYIPGTDKSDFYIAFDEIKGKQFLAAIESMRGTGAISDREGEAATKAVSRLSTGLSEKEFRKALFEFNSMMRRYADRAATKIGEPKPFNEPTMSEQAKTNRAAQEWLRKNPNDPQADAVREKLRRQGLID